MNDVSQKSLECSKMDALVVFVFSLLITVGLFAVVTFTIVVPLIDKTANDLSVELDKAIKNVKAQQVAREAQSKIAEGIFDFLLLNTGTGTSNTHTSNTSVSTSNTYTNTYTSNTSTNTDSSSMSSSSSSNVSDVLSTLTAAIGGTNCTTGQYFANGTCVTPVQNAKTNPVLVQNLQTVVHDLITLVANTQ